MDLFARPGAVVDDYDGLPAQVLGVTEADEIATYNNRKVVALDPTQRAGILTQPAFLMAEGQSSNRESEAIPRGVHILTDVMCGVLPAPGDFVVEPVIVGENQTARDAIAYTTDSDGCADCHNQINPIGLALEAYDALGRYRDEHNGKTLITAGDFGDQAVCDSNRIEFANAVEMSQKAAENVQVKHCYATQWFKYANRRNPNNSGLDAKALGDIYERFEASGFRIRDLMVAIAVSHSFTHRGYVKEQP